MILLHGDCLDLMAQIPDGSVDMVMCDLPYGTTACKWDTVIPFAPLWAHYKRVCKRNAAIVLTASQPFTSVLACSNLAMFRYCWVWDKAIASGFNYARFQPMRQHEDVLVFYADAPVYDSQGDRYQEKIRYRPGRNSPSDSAHMTNRMGRNEVLEATHQKKRSIIRLDKVRAGDHPTEKPVELMEYLIRTYTDAGATVLDNCMGSGTTGVACVNLGREFIGIERDPDYFRIASERIAKAQNPVQARLIA